MTLRLVLLLMMAVEVKSMDLLGKFLVNMSVERVMKKLHHPSFFFRPTKYLLECSKSNHSKTRKLYTTHE